MHIRIVQLIAKPGQVHLVHLIVFALRIGEPRTWLWIDSSPSFQQGLYSMPHANQHETTLPEVCGQFFKLLGPANEEDHRHLDEGVEYVLGEDCVWLALSLPRGWRGKLAEHDHLHFRGESSLTDDEFALLGLVPSLHSLDLRACKNIVGTGFVHLRGLPELDGIYLPSNFTDAGFESLSCLTGLTTLDLLLCESITDAGIAHLCSLSQLKSLNLKDCNRVTDAGLKHLRELKALEVLHLPEGITDVGLAYIEGHSALRALDQNYCNSITDIGLASLQGLTALESLSLGFCKNITDSGLMNLRDLHALTFLNLTRCDQISDAGIAQLQVLPSLATLHLPDGAVAQ